MTDWPPTFPKCPVMLQEIPLACHGLVLMTMLRQYPGCKLYRFDGDRAAEDQFRELTTDARDSIDVLYGLVRYGLHRLISGPVPFLTLLRDPVERIVSHYYSVLAQPSHHLHAVVTSRGLSLYEYVERRTTVELDNGQVRWLSREAENVNLGGMTLAMLDEAKRNLEHDDTVFGLAERNDETLLIFARAMGWNDVRYQDGAGMLQRPTPSLAVPDETRELIRETNALDIELYEFASDLFEQRIARLGDQFQAHLREYRELNAELAERPNWSDRAADEKPTPLAVGASPANREDRALPPARDIFWLTSYPRSGNTWLRFLLDAYFFPPAALMQEVARLSSELDWWILEASRLGHGLDWIPDAVRCAQAMYARPEGCPGDLFFKSHYLLSPQHPLIERTRAAIYLVRNPRDVLLSGMNFSELTTEAAGEGERAYALAYIERGGDQLWIQEGYGTWSQNVRSWLGQAPETAIAASKPVASPQGFPVLPIRYEDLKSDAPGQLTRILQFMGVTTDQQRIHMAVEHCSLPRLRNLERASRAMSQMKDMKKDGRFFFHKGLSGQSLAPLGQDVEEAFDRTIGADGRLLGYR